MIKKLFLFPLFLMAISLSITSCLNNDDNEETIDQEWKMLNETRFNKVVSDDLFNELSSQSNNGLVCWKALHITMEGKPEFTDTVMIRYEGWYFDKLGKKIIFDSTENPSLISNINYNLGLAPSKDPNKQQVKFAVNSLIDGKTTILQDMRAGEEREVCIPHQLGYGGSPSTYRPTATTTYTIIPAYTTLWFNVKLIQIIPMKGTAR
ncbi:MAG: hypothetical protein RL662_1400 [Bacteroidota bacterium]|jgi:FKBP-type peptidyl-prolyl cis-trans isomerase